MRHSQPGKYPSLGLYIYRGLCAPQGELWSIVEIHLVVLVHLGGE